MNIKTENLDSVVIQEFQIIFDKLQEIKQDNQELFSIASEGTNTLSHSINEIKKIVDSYSAPNNIITFTKA